MYERTVKSIRSAILRAEKELEQAKKSNNERNIESYQVQLAHLKAKLRQLRRGAYPTMD